MRLNIRLMLFTVVLLSLGVTVRADEQDDYARQVRQEVWNWDKPEFRNYQVPDEYKNESAVVLARHQEIELRSKRIVQLVRLYYTEIDRRMVKINDNASLEHFSDLSFAEKAKFRSATYGGKNQLRTIIGVRVIKPDGTIQDVDIDESVLVNDEKKKKETHRKLAIPGLQVGDVIDYFYCEILTLDEYTPPPVWFAFYSNYPTLSYSARCVFNTKHLSVEYAVLNGATDFTRTPVGDDETELKFHATNLSKVPEGRYITYLRDTPMIRLRILNNKNVWTSGSPNARKPGIHKLGDSFTSRLVISDASYRSVLSTYYPEYGKPYLKDWKKYLKNYFKAHPGLSNLDKTDYIYYYMYVEWPRGSDVYNSNAYMSLFHTLLMEFDIPHEYILMTNLYGPRMDDVLAPSDVDDALRVEGKYYTSPFGYRVAGWLYPDNQGQEAFVMDRWEMVNGKLKNAKNKEDEYIVTPTTTAAENKSIQRLTVKLSQANPLELDIRREVQRSGALKEYYQDLFGNYEQWDTNVRQYYPNNMTYWEMLKDKKWSNKDIENRRTAFDKHKESLSDSVKVEINGFHDADAKAVSGYNVHTLGVVPAEPDFTYDVTYTIEGFVKRAGNNWIIDAGKLLGNQWEPTRDDHERTVNAHLSTPRRFENEITLHIPDGYEALETEKLNLSVDNDVASFRSTAKVEGNTLKISKEKVYKKTFIPVAEWPKFLEIADEAVKFEALSVVLRKK